MKSVGIFTHPKLQGTLDQAFWEKTPPLYHHGLGPGISPLKSTSMNVLPSSHLEKDISMWFLCSCRLKIPQPHTCPHEREKALPRKD